MKSWSKFLCLGLVLSLLITLTSIKTAQTKDNSRFYGFADVRILASSSNLEYVATGSSLGTVVWDSDRERVKYTFAEPPQKIVFSLDNTQLAIASQVAKDTPQQISLYNLDRGNILKQWSDAKLPEYSPDGKILGFVRGKRLHLVSLPTFSQLKPIEFPQPITAFAFAPNRQIAVGTEQGNVYVYDLQSQQITTADFGRHKIIGLDFAPQHPWLLIRTSVNVKLRSLTDERARTIPTTSKSEFTPQGNLLLYDYPNPSQFTIKNLSTSQTQQQFHRYNHAFDISSDGKYLAVGSADERMHDGGVELYSLNSDIELTKKFNMGWDEVRKVRFSKDGTKILAFGSESAPSIATYNYHIQIWDFATAKKLKVLDGYFGLDPVAKVSPNRQYVAAADGFATDTHHQIFLLDFQTGKKLARIPLNRSQSSSFDYLQLYFSQDEKQLAAELLVSQGNNPDAEQKLFSVFSIPDGNLIGEYSRLPNNFIVPGQQLVLPIDPDDRIFQYRL